MKFQFTVNYIDQAGVVTAKQYNNQTTSQVEGLLHEYLSDTTITNVKFNGGAVPVAPAVGGR